MREIALVAVGVIAGGFTGVQVVRKQNFCPFSMYLVAADIGVPLVFEQLHY